MSDDRNEAMRAHQRIYTLAAEMDKMEARLAQRRPLTPRQLECLIVFFNTWMEAKIHPDAVSHLEAKTVREELLEAFSITEDELDAVKR